MKWFKLFDIIAQLLVPIITLLTVKGQTFLVAYFTLGIWQILSCVLHMLVYSAVERNRGRRRYEKTLAWVLAIAAVIGGLAYLEIHPAMVALFILGCVMLMGGLVMGFWYLITCIDETWGMFEADKIKG